MSETNHQQSRNPAPSNGAKPPRRVRLYAVMRIIDNRVQFLAPSDPENDASEPEWTDLGGETCIWEDRETAFQIGRRLGGLLVSVEGVPGGRRTLAFHARVAEIRKEIEEAENEEADGAVQTGEEEEAKGGVSAAKRIAENRAKAKAAREASRAADKVPMTPAPVAEEDEVPY